MQLFGLVNTLLQSDDATAKAHLSIQRYSVIPLSPNSGLIGYLLHPFGGLWFVCLFVIFGLVFALMVSIFMIIV